MIRELTENLDIISALDNEPNDEGGLSAPELKAKFDEGGNAIKDYINGTLIPDVSGMISSSVAAAELAAGNLPNGGTEGQMLMKNSDAEYDLVYADLPTNADTLTTPRAVQTDLASALAADFDGSADITPGVTGVLSITNGGTGADNAEEAALALGRGLGSCETAAESSAKEVTLAGFECEAGAILGVTFANANKAVNPTLNINSSGEAAIIDGMTGAGVGKDKMTAHTHFFQYDGTGWILLNPTEWKYVTGVFTASSAGAITLDFTPTALVSQVWNGDGVNTGGQATIFGGLTTGVEQIQKQHGGSGYYVAVTATAAGFTYRMAGAIIGTVRYIAFV